MVSAIFERAVWKLYPYQVLVFTSPRPHPL